MRNSIQGMHACVIKPKTDKQTRSTATECKIQKSGGDSNLH